MVLEILARAIRKEGQNGKRSQRLPFVDDVSLYLRNLKSATATTTNPRVDKQFQQNGSTEN